MGPTVIRVIVDIFLVVIPAVILLILIILNPTFERGFYCDDESLRYPYKGDTVSIVVAGIVAGLLPALIIIAVEIFRKRNHLNKKEGRNKLAYNIYSHLGPFIVGLVFQQVTAEIGKHIIGRLRPHFFDVCKPSFLLNGEMLTCDKIDKPWMHYIIVDRDNHSAFMCTNQDHVDANGDWDSTLKDSVKSFPSAHSSVSFYGMVFLAFYFQKRVDFYKHANLLTIFWQGLFVVVAFGIALSRISDYKHHWSDVLSGSVLGIVTAIMISSFADFIAATTSSNQTNTKKSDTQGTFMKFEEGLEEGKNSTQPMNSIQTEYGSTK